MMEQLTAFKCDRCEIKTAVPLNQQLAMERGKPPSGWLALYVGENTAPATHLCSICAPLFQAFMLNREGE